jgi:hypothetical protein
MQSDAMRRSGARDARTPVVVGVGQAAERIDDAYYQGMSAVELAAGGARAALDDCGADAAKVAASIDTIAGVRQFEISGPAKAVLGKSNNYPRSVANRIGADPARVILEVVGGQGPQHLITELASEIAAGRSEVAMVFGSDATSTNRYFAGPIIGRTSPKPLTVRWKTAATAWTDLSAATRSFMGLSMRPLNTGCWRMPGGPEQDSGPPITYGGWASCSLRSPRWRPRTRSPPRRSNAASRN